MSDTPLTPDPSSTPPLLGSQSPTSLHDALAEAVAGHAAYRDQLAWQGRQARIVYRRLKRDRPEPFEAGADEHDLAMKAIKLVLLSQKIVHGQQAKIAELAREVARLRMLVLGQPGNAGSGDHP